MKYFLPLLLGVTVVIIVILSKTDLIQVDKNRQSTPPINSTPPPEAEVPNLDEIEGTEGIDDIEGIEELDGIEEINGMEEREAEKEIIGLESPNTEPSNTEPSNTESSNIESPNIESPNTEVPNTEVPNTEVTNIESLNTEASKEKFAEEVSPKGNDSKGDDSEAQNPKAEDSKEKVSKVENPKENSSKSTILEQIFKAEKSEFLQNYDKAPNIKTEHIATLYNSEKNASPAGKKVLEQARKIALEERRIIKGSCWDYLHAVFNSAGVERETIHKGTDKDELYVNTNKIKSGDWLYHINLSYNNIGHSGMFVGWVDKSQKKALMLSYRGENSEKPARYKVYDISKTFNVMRPILATTEY